MSIEKYAFVNDETRTVINVIKADSENLPSAPEGQILVLALSWMSPNVVYGFRDEAHEERDVCGDCETIDESGMIILCGEDYVDVIRLKHIAEIKAERNKQIYGVAYVNDGEADETVLVLTETNRDILSRKAQVVEQFGPEADIVFTGSDIPQVKLGDEEWLEAAVADCLPWSMQAEFLSQKAFNQEKASQDSINAMRDEVIAETKTLQEFTDFDFIAEYNVALKASIQDHSKFAYPQQYHNEDEV